MVAPANKNVLHFLRVLHRTPKAVGIEEFTRTDASLPDARTLYRWQAELADDLLYYPNVTFAALGLEHVHLFLENPAAAWTTFPYAIAGEWVVSRPSEKSLYLHCLIPRSHRDAIEALFADAQGKTAARLTSVATHDGWQVLRDLAIEDVEPVPAVALSAQKQDVWDIVERLPLLIPVIFETVEQRQSLPAIWEAVYARLGKRTWDFLPRFARRLPTNGKSYVKESFALLNHTGLFRQNVIRYRPLNAIGTPMFLHVEGTHVSDMINAFGKDAPLIDIYPMRDDAALLRLVSTHALTQHVFSSMNTLPRMTSWHFVDVLRNAREPVKTRFAYEVLFDPTTTEWVLPHSLLQEFRGDP
jgi:hypothetical protein